MGRRKNERILGSGDFVEKLTKEEELVRKYRLTVKERGESADGLGIVTDIMRICGTPFTSIVYNLNIFDIRVTCT